MSTNFVRRFFFLFAPLAVFSLMASGADAANFQFVRAFAPHGISPGITGLAADTDDGHLYVSVDGYEFEDRALLSYDVNGNYLGTIGGAEAPNDVATDSVGSVYLADGFSGLTFGYGVHHLTYSPNPTHAGGSHFVAADSAGPGHVWATDDQGTVTRFSATSGQVLSQFNIPDTFSSGNDLLKPTAIAVNAAGTRIYVALVTTSIGPGGNHILEFSSNGTLIGQIGSSGSGNGQLDLAYSGGLALDTTNHLYVGDTGNNRIQIFDALTGQYLSQFGTPGTGNGQFQSPMNIAVDSLGNLWVGDNGGGPRIQQFALVPEPSAALLFAIGSIGLIGMRRFRRRLTH